MLQSSGTRTEPVAVTISVAVAAAVVGKETGDVVTSPAVDEDDEEDDNDEDDDEVDDFPPPTPTLDIDGNTLTCYKKLSRIEKDNERTIKNEVALSGEGRLFILRF